MTPTTTRRALLAGDAGSGRPMQGRRDFVATLASACAAGLLGAARPAAADEPPEVTTVRLPKVPGICLAPSYMAEELLRAEGFGDVRYVPVADGTGTAAMAARGDLDFDMNFVAAYLPVIDAGEALTILAGVHPGCFELRAGERVRGVTDLRGKRVGVPGVGTGVGQYLFVASIASYVGLDPAKDIDWVVSTAPGALDLFAEGKVDAIMAFPPEPQELRARQVGRVIVSTALDRPWSEYFCCMLAGNADFVRKNPVATKRVVRAVLKAADICVSEPARAAQRLIDRKFAARYDYALQTLTELPYARWRDYDPEDTVRFYTLRLHEAGVIKSSPKRIIAEGTDWRFLNEIKRELKS